MLETGLSLGKLYKLGSSSIVRPSDQVRQDIRFRSSLSRGSSEIEEGSCLVLGGFSSKEVEIIFSCWDY